MASDTQPRQPDAAADLEAVIAALAAGKPPGPEVARRVRQRSEEVRQEVLRTHGVLNVAVDLVREARKEG